MDGVCNDFIKAFGLLKKYDGKNPFQKEISNGIKNYCDSSNASFYYQRGIANYNLRDYQKAIHYYDVGLRKFPGHSLLINFKGNALIALRKYNEAIAEYEKMIGNRINVIAKAKAAGVFSAQDSTENYADGIIASSYLSVADANTALNNYQEALKNCNTAIDLVSKLHSSPKEIFYEKRGLIFFATNKFQVAEKDFNTAIELNPQYANPYAYRTMCYIQKSGNQKLIVVNFASFNNESFWKFAMPAELNRALSDCQKAISINDNFGYAYFVLGYLKTQMNIEGYCYDLLKAQTLGEESADNLLYSCYISLQINTNVYA